MRLTELSSDQRADVVQRALVRAREAVALLAEDSTVETVDQLQAEPFGMLLYAALWIIDDGRRYATRVLQTCDELIHTAGSDVDEARRSLHLHIRHALTKLAGALELRLEAEAIPSDARRAIVHRAIGLSADALAHPIDEAALTDRQCLAAALAIVSERLAIVGQRQPVTRCAWCIRAGASAPPLRQNDPAVGVHLLECPHNPTAAAYRALKTLADTSRRRVAGDKPWNDGLTLTEWIQRRLDEVEEIRQRAFGGQPTPSELTAINSSLFAGDLAIRTLHEVAFAMTDCEADGDALTRLGSLLLDRMASIDASLARAATQVSADALTDRLRDAVSISPEQLREVLEACHPNVADPHLTASLGDDAPNLPTLYNHVATALQLEGAVAARRVVAEIYTRWRETRRAAE